MSRTIVTHCEFPPIPIRDFDWCAHYEGQEEFGGYGWGRTEAEAIADFEENYAGGDEAVRTSAREGLRFTPWLRCPSTHCERRGECASPRDCEATKLPPPKIALSPSQQGGENG